MANWLSSKDGRNFKVNIPLYLKTNYYTLFEIEIHFSTNIKWKTHKRYSEFHKLYDELVKMDSKYKVFFPPKRAFNNTSDYFLDQRRKCLESFLNEVITVAPDCLPRSLALFLELDKYEIHGITTSLSKALFNHGPAILNSTKTFNISVFTVHAINKRMQSPAPTNLYAKPDEDFGNLLDVIGSIKKVRIVPNSITVPINEGYIGSSNIKINNLTFDISIFSGVTVLKMNSVEIVYLRGLHKMNSSVEKLQVQHCLKSLDSILLGDLGFQSSNIIDLLNFDGPWRCVTDADFSRNSITKIDASIVCLRQLQTLNLSQNQICEIDNLQYFVFLTYLDLSYNNLYVFQNQNLFSRLGSVKSLSLRGNKLEKLNLIDRLFSLEYLDVSENCISNYVTLLPFCRLSCLNVLLFKTNPICSDQNFIPALFDMFLENYNSISINGLTMYDIPPAIQNSIIKRRSSKKAMIFGNQTYTISSDASGDSSFMKDEPSLLMTLKFQLDLSDDQYLRSESILNIPDVYNILTYWLYSASNRVVVCSKLLACTEIYPSNITKRPTTILLVTSGSLTTSILKCSIDKLSTKDEKSMYVIKPLGFLDLNTELKALVIGAEKSFLRFDLNSDHRSLYICNMPYLVESFIAHLFHIDDGIASLVDSRIACLNSEDRTESLRRFIDIWRLDLVAEMIRRRWKNDISTDSESEILFCERAMLQNRNGFQLLLTVIVTRQMLCFVDERIFDCLDISKKSQSFDSYGTSLSNASPFTSSGFYQFLRTEAFFFDQIKSCMRQANLSTDPILSVWCPTFSYPITIMFNVDRDQIILHFESSKQSDTICQIVNQLSEDSFPVQIPKLPEPVSYRLSMDIPSHFKWVDSTYNENQLFISLTCPKLGTIAPTSHAEILDFCMSKIQNINEDRILGLFWSKFIYINFEAREHEYARKEILGLVCLTRDRISVIYEICEETEDIECYSDPESDQQDGGSPVTKIGFVTLETEYVFKLYIGLFNQWVTLNLRRDDRSSENIRLILLLRNSDLCKQFIRWMRQIFNHQSTIENDLEESIEEDSSSVAKIQLDSSEGTLNELIYQIMKTSGCTDTDIIHYISVDDIRFDSGMFPTSSNVGCAEVFSSAVVITNHNVTFVRHNVVEYPIREFCRGDVRQSPNHLKFQILKVLPLFEFLQLQLPGHDRTQLIFVIRSNVKHTSTYTIHVSITCQKEQKLLIDKLRCQWSKSLQAETPLLVSVC